MKKYFMDLFEIEAGEFTAKDFVAAGGSLVLALGIIFLPLFM